MRALISILTLSLAACAPAIEWRQDALADGLYWNALRDTYDDCLGDPSLGRSPQNEGRGGIACLNERFLLRAAEQCLDTGAAASCRAKLLSLKGADHDLEAHFIDYQRGGGY